VQSAVLLSHVVCPSVCLSVTLVDHDDIGWTFWKLIAWTFRPTSSLFIAQRSSTYSKGNMEKFWWENVRSTPTSIHNVRLNWVNRESRDFRWRCGCLFIFVGASRGNLCNSTAFLFYESTHRIKMPVLIWYIAEFLAFVSGNEFCFFSLPGGICPRPLPSLPVPAGAHVRGCAGQRRECATQHLCTCCTQWPTYTSNHSLIDISSHTIHSRYTAPCNGPVGYTIRRSHRPSASFTPPL